MGGVRASARSGISRGGWLDRGAGVKRRRFFSGRYVERGSNKIDKIARVIIEIGVVRYWDIRERATLPAEVVTAGSEDNENSRGGFY